MKIKTITKILCIILICCFSFVFYASVSAKTIEDTEVTAKIKEKHSQKIIVEEIKEKNNEMKISDEGITLSSTEKTTKKYTYESTDDFDFEYYFKQTKLMRDDFDEFRDSFEEFKKNYTEKEKKADEMKKVATTIANTKFALAESAKIIKILNSLNEEDPDNYGASIELMKELVH